MVIYIPCNLLFYWVQHLVFLLFMDLLKSYFFADLNNSSWGSKFHKLIIGCV